MPICCHRVSFHIIYILSLFFVFFHLEMFYLVANLVSSSLSSAFLLTFLLSLILFRFWTLTLFFSLFAQEFSIQILNDSSSLQIVHSHPFIRTSKEIRQTCQIFNCPFFYLNLDNIHNCNDQMTLYYSAEPQLFIDRYSPTLSMSFQRTPHQFMEGVFIAPHSFSDPEHPEHGDYVNVQLRNDLYHEALYKITASQFSLFGPADEQLEVAKISKCEGPDPVGGFASKLSNTKIPKEDNQLISCMDWKINRMTSSSKTTSKYRVKIFQSKKDIFYSEIHPPNAWKLFKFYLFN